MASSDGDNLEATFERAALHLRTLGTQLGPDQLLYFYARFKQAKEGRCNIPKPGFFDFQGKQKWTAWSSLGDMSRRAAMAEYVQAVDEMDPDWLVRFDEKTASRKSPMGGLSVSSMAKTEPDLDDDQKTIFDWVKEGDLQRVEGILQEDADGEHLRLTDDDGMTLLHWSCDRGYLGIAEVLLKQGSFINCLDSGGQVPLHYAASCGHTEVVKMLVDHGADVGVRDENDCLPLDLAECVEIRKILST